MGGDALPARQLDVAGFLQRPQNPGEVPTVLSEICKRWLHQRMSCQRRKSITNLANIDT